MPATIAASGGRRPPGRQRGRSSARRGRARLKPVEGARRQRLILGALTLAAVALVAGVLLHRKPVKAATPHAVPVTVARAATQDAPLTLTALGAAQAWTSDAIFAQVSGKLVRVNFTEGAEVKAGQVLAEVDPAPYRAALTQAEGALKRDQAILAGARRDLTRYQHLLAENAIARQTVEDQAATVAQDEGVVQVDEGQVATARINLGYCRIVSPIAGRAGVRLVDAGNIVSASGSVASTPNTAAATSSAASSGAASPAAGTTAGGGGGASGSTNSSGSGIVVINQIEPIAVTFTVPQGEFQRLAALSDGFRRPLFVQAYSQETNDLLGDGELTAADNRVDAATGTVELKARFLNPGRRLWPGQFVNVKLTLQTLRNATLIPAAAVNRGPKGQFAFVVGADSQAVMRPLVLVATEGGQAIVRSGVRPGELVVVDGQMSLRNGSLVRAGETGAPAASAAGPPR